MQSKNRFWKTIKTGYRYLVHVYLTLAVFTWLVPSRTKFSKAPDELPSWNPWPAEKNCEIQKKYFTLQLVIQLLSLQETIRRRRFIFVTKALLKRSICHENGFTHDRLCPCAHRKTIIIIGLLTKFHGIERRRRRSRWHLLSALIRKISEKKNQLKLEIFGELTCCSCKIAG